MTNRNRRKRERRKARIEDARAIGDAHAKALDERKELLTWVPVQCDPLEDMFHGWSE